MSDPRQAATAHTADANRRAGESMPAHDRSDPADPDDFELARYGQLAPLTEPVTHPTWGHNVWDPHEYDFLDEACPPEANPSLWRQARLNAISGLFEVAPGFYQVRGMDLSNITFIAGRTGWIVIDPLSSAETAADALTLLHQHLEPREIAAVIYTHSHIDHFGGVRGIIDDDDVDSGRVRVIAPVGFLEAAIAENVIAGSIMARRATYMYGRLLPIGPRGHIDCGLGKAIPLLGTSGLIAPTEEIATTGTELDVDGVRIVFQYTPNTEAPAEMNFFFPDHQLLCMAENCSATLHNVYTPRGAQVRDALAWSKYIDESIALFGPDTDTVFMSHHWPRVGNAAALRFMRAQRDAYRYVHDQTMRRANAGETGVEIAEDLALPPGLRDVPHVRGYYGTVSHNVKAVYQRYLGWFDANPAHLHQLPPVDAGRRYVELAGGADELLRKARAAFDDGDYRWVAELVNHLVFADPDNAEAKALQADTLEQLGYRAESGPWRDFYLTGAQELRAGHPPLPGGLGSLDMIRAMTPEMLCDLWAVRLNGPAAVGAAFTLNLELTDLEQVRLLELVNCTLRSVADTFDDEAPTIATTHFAFALLVSQTKTLDDLLADGELTIRGDDAPVRQLLSLLDTFSMYFPIVTP